MAATGKGKFPLKSVWATRKRLGSATPFVKQPFPYDKDTAEATVFNDWFFPATSTTITGTSSQALAGVTGSATGTVSGGPVGVIFRDKSQGSISAPGATFSVDRPSGTVSGDFQLLLLTCDNNARSHTVSGGGVWTLLGTKQVVNAAGADGCVVEVFKQVAGASEPLTYTVTEDTSQGSGTTAYCILSYSGVDTTTPIDVWSVVNANSTTIPASPVTMTATAVVTTVANTMLVYLSAWDASNSGAIGSYTSPSGYTGRVSESVASNFSNAFADDKGLATAGGSGTPGGVVTQSATSGNFITYLVALKPTSGGAVTGTSSQTLAGVTGSATGQIVVSGTSSATLAAVSGSSVGTVVIAGTSSVTLGDVSGSATGTVGTSVTGTSSQTLAAVTGPATGNVIVAGVSSQTLPTTTGSATGTVLVAGSSSQTLDSVTGSATGTVSSAEVTGTSVQTLDGVSGSATGTILGQQVIGATGWISVDRKRKKGKAKDLWEDAKEHREDIVEAVEAAIEQLSPTHSMRSQPLRTVRVTPRIEVRAELYVLQSWVVELKQLRDEELRRIADEDDEERYWLLLLAG